MAIINREAVIPYTPHQMFDLVNRIEDYPHFVPWCKSAEVLSRSDEEIHAKLDFARGGLQKSFTTCNRLQENKMIEIRLINGPFRHLEGFWRFEPYPEGGARIRLDLEFEFTNKLMGMMFAPVFHPVADTLVDVFCKRAHEVYGA
jgi:ribosome-associated toxin RatA of RatAB toxin-antitoxin module